MHEDKRPGYILRIGVRVSKKEWMSPLSLVLERDQNGGIECGRF